MMTTLFAEPLRGGDWCIVDADMRRVGALSFNSKAEAVAEIRAIQPLSQGVLFYRRK